MAEEKFNYTKASRDNVSNQGDIGTGDNLERYEVGDGFKSGMFTYKKPWEDNQYLEMSARNLNSGGSNGRLQGDGFFTRLAGLISANRAMKPITPINP